MEICQRRGRYFRLAFKDDALRSQEELLHLIKPVDHYRLDVEHAYKMAVLDADDDALLPLHDSIIQDLNKTEEGRKIIGTQLGREKAILEHMEKLKE